MTKSQIIESLSTKLGIDRTRVRTILKELVTLAVHEVQRHGEFAIPKFGKLVLAGRQKRSGRNPATGEAIMIPRRVTLKLLVGKALRDAVISPSVMLADEELADEEFDEELDEEPGEELKYREVGRMDEDFDEDVGEEFGYSEWRKPIRPRRPSVSIPLRESLFDRVYDLSNTVRSKRFEQARYVNVCLAHPDRSAVPKRTNLGRAKTYYLRLNIGRLSKESVVENPERFPDRQLPETESGHWLAVVVVSDDFLIDRSRYHLFLPDVGESWICSCTPEGDHRCSKDTRSAQLFIPFSTPSKRGRFRLRIGIYYSNNLIQSQLLAARVGETERGGLGYSSYIDYTLSAKLYNIGSFPPRTLNILTNQNDDGTHKVVINGRIEDAVSFNFTEGQIRNSIDSVRQALRNIHVLDKGGNPPNLVNLYDQNNAKTKDKFVEDLKQLGWLGWTLWTLLLTDKPELQKKISKELLRESSSIQVCRVSGSKFVFPWALVYDIPLTSTSEEYTECQLLREWENAESLIPETNPQCPYENQHGLNVICPFGFWGFKHTIEQPPSMPKNRDLASEIIVGNHPLEMVVALSRDLIEKMTNAHLKEMTERLDKFDVLAHDSQKEIVNALGDSKLEAVYFYCHGKRQPLPGSSEPIPYLGVGKGEMFAPSDLVAWKLTLWPEDHWQKTSPLIFINGCHTAELTPESLVNFVDAFFGVYASGVIGTEVTLHQQVAGEAAVEFFANFQSQGVGRALQLMRRRFLLKGNMLGLAYTLYCSTALHFSK